jgi:hypothetical protein
VADADSSQIDADDSQVAARIAWKGTGRFAKLKGADRLTPLVRAAYYCTEDNWHGFGAGDSIRHRRIRHQTSV